MVLLALTSLILFTIVLFVALDVDFSWVFYLTVVGQVLLVVMVYKVLTDNYQTNKTFDDFYEDRPMKN